MTTPAVQFADFAEHAVPVDRADIRQIATEELVGYERIDDLKAEHIPDAVIRYAVDWLTERVMLRWVDHLSSASPSQWFAWECCLELILEHIAGVRTMRREGR